MDLKEIGANTRNRVDSVQNRDPCECDIEPTGSVNHGVNVMGKEM